MKKGGGSENTIIIGLSKSVLVYALHNLGIARFRVFVPELLFYYKLLKLMKKNMKSETNGVLRVEKQRSIPRIVSIVMVRWTKSYKKFVLILSKQS